MTLGTPGKLALLFAVAGAANAYYHFIHFDTRTAPFRPIYEKFDLNALPNRTLPWLLSDISGVQFAANDSPSALVSQIRAAADIWDNVESSDLRLEFGGFTTSGSAQNSPHVEILFSDEVPPGLVAAGTPTVRADSNGTFVPILKSVVILRNDLRNRPSYTEAFFGTMVHEIGHGLGLQHTFTSSVMSTTTTRATSKARPLTSDDIAALSVLYGRPSFAQTTGVLTGRVVMNGAGVNLASVVAIAPNGGAVSTLTNPDGTYRIEGLPPRSYYVYAHPLPPPIQGQTTPGDVVPPIDSDRRPFPAAGPFDTVFFPGVEDVGRAFIVPVAAGGSVENINFNVRPRATPGIHSVETFAFQGSTAFRPPYLSPGTTRPFIVATGAGLISGAGPVPGLTATILGGGTLGVRPYAPAPTSFIQLDFDPRQLLISPDSARHIVFSLNNDVYVLPAAFFHVERQAPAIMSVTPSFDATGRGAVITGTNLLLETRILFDGVPAQVRGFEESGGIGKITVSVPAGTPGHRATIVALNPDGQSSLFHPPELLQTYSYDGATLAAAGVTVTPAALPAGTEAMVQVDAPGASFAEKQVAVSFGSSDVVARRVWVVSPTRLLVNVSAAASAQPGVLNMTVASGLQLITQPSVMQVTGPQARSFWLTSWYMNTATGQPFVTAGSPVTLLVGASPTPITAANTAVILNEVRIPVLAASGNSVSFLIPAGTPLGPTVLRLETAGERSLPIILPIEPPAPRILSVTTIPALDGRGPRPGDNLVLKVQNLDPEKSTVLTYFAGREVKPLAVLRELEGHSVVVRVPDDTLTGMDILITVSADSRVSDPIRIRVGA